MSRFSPQVLPHATPSFGQQLAEALGEGIDAYRDAKDRRRRDDRLDTEDALREMALAQQGVHRTPGDNAGLQTPVRTEVMGLDLPDPDTYLNSPSPTQGQSRPSASGFAPTADTPSTTAGAFNPMTGTFNSAIQSPQVQTRQRDITTFGSGRTRGYVDNDEAAANRARGFHQQLAEALATERGVQGVREEFDAPKREQRLQDALMQLLLRDQLGDDRAETQHGYRVNEIDERGKFSHSRAATAPSPQVRQFGVANQNANAMERDASHAEHLIPHRTTLAAQTMTPEQERAFLQDSTSAASTARTLRQQALGARATADSLANVVTRGGVGPSAAGDESQLSDADLWEQKRRQGMSPTQATIYVTKRSHH